MNIRIAEHCIETLKSLRCLSEDDYAADRTVQTMRQTLEDLTGLCIALGNEGLVSLCQGFIRGLVTLDNLPYLLVHDKKMVVFIKYSGCEVVKLLARQFSVNHVAKLAILSLRKSDVTKKLTFWHIFYVSWSWHKFR